LKSKATAEFWREFERLPREVQVLAEKAYSQFENNPGYAGLDLKKVGSRRTVYSVRIGGAYRALGVMRGDTVTWFWIGHHRDYDRLLRDL
jgi:hypothetical protein